MSQSPAPVEAYGAWLAQAPSGWGEAAERSAHRQFIDTIAVMIPGALEPVSRKTFALASRWGSGQCRAAGFPARLSAPFAALVNGASGHALDFDDNFDPAKAHASTVLVPAILAVADEEDLGGAACLDAYIAGLQIQARVGQALNPVHRNRGWHATGTTGALGAAAASARLLGLDARASAMALSISTSMAGGFMSQFGSMTKPLHAGFAAKAGVMAAYLAREGVTGGLETLDGPNAMNTLMVGPDLAALRENLPRIEHGQTLRFETRSIGEPLAITEYGFRVKRFANCGSAHRAMDGLLELMEKHGFGAGSVEAVHVHAPRTHLNNLMYESPETGLQAKFSLEYALACLLATGGCTLEDFSDEAVRREAVRALFPRIHRHPADKSEGEFPTLVLVELADGRKLETSVAMPAGSKPAPFSDEQYWRKFHDCVGPHMSASQIAELEACLRALPGLARARDLTAACAVDLNRSRR